MPDPTKDAPSSDEPSEAINWRDPRLRSGLDWDAAGFDSETPQAEAPEDLTPTSAQPAAIPPGGFSGAQPYFEAADEEPLTDEIGWPMLCCLAGPCQDYQEIIQVSRVVKGVEHRNVYRYCTRLGEDAGTMALRDLTIRGCSAFRPPLLSLAGWRQRLLMSGLRIQSARKFGGNVTVSLRVQRAVAKLLGYPKTPGKSVTELDKRRRQSGN